MARRRDTYCPRFILRQWVSLRRGMSDGQRQPLDSLPVTRQLGLASETSAGDHRVRLPGHREKSRASRLISLMGREALSLLDKMGKHDRSRYLRDALRQSRGAPQVIGELKPQLKSGRSDQLGILELSGRFPVAHGISPCQAPRCLRHAARHTPYLVIGRDAAVTEGGIVDTQSLRGSQWKAVDNNEIISCRACP